MFPSPDPAHIWRTIMSSFLVFVEWLSLSWHKTVWRCWRRFMAYSSDSLKTFDSPSSSFVSVSSGSWLRLHWYFWRHVILSVFYYPSICYFEEIDQWIVILRNIQAPIRMGCYCDNLPHNKGDEGCSLHDDSLQTDLYPRCRMSRSVSRLLVFLTPKYFASIILLLTTTIHCQ